MAGEEEEGGKVWATKINPGGIFSLYCVNTTEDDGDWSPLRTAWPQSGETQGGTSSIPFPAIAQRLETGARLPSFKFHIRASHLIYPISVSPCEIPPTQGCCEDKNIQEVLSKGPDIQLTFKVRHIYYYNQLKVSLSLFLNWSIAVVLKKTLESPLDCKENKPVNPKRNQSWIFIGGHQ